MADSTTPFTNEEWNQIIRDINAIVPECEGVDPLDEVDPCHRLTITDITAAQDKLVALCDANVFTAPIPPDAKWLQTTIQEIEDAILEGTCCCEETNWNPTRKLFHIEYFVRHTNLNGGLTSMTVSPVAWMGQEDPAYPLTITEQPCPGDPETTIQVREGGRFWVGSQYRFWDLYIFMGDGTAPSTAPGGVLRLTGIVKDGYMVVPPATGGTNPTCSTGSTGNPLGEKDPSYGWPFEVCAGTETTETVCSTVDSYENVITLDFSNGGFEYPDGQMTPNHGGDTWWTFTAAPFFIPNPGFDQSGFFDPFIRDIQGRVTLRC